MKGRGNGGLSHENRGRGGAASKKKEVWRRYEVRGGRWGELAKDG